MTTHSKAGLPIRLADTLQHSASTLRNRLLARGKFRHLQVLLHLAELGSVQRAADAMDMTQSSVTQTLAYLENLLEIRLFDRHARGVRPTTACTDLLPVARQLLMGLDEGAEIVAARQNRGQGLVRLLGSATAINGVLVGALPAFCDAFADTHVRLEEAEGEDQLLAIARGEADLVVCRKPRVIPAGWEFHPLREDRFVIVCRPTHRLARARAVRSADLPKETWLLLPAGVGGRGLFDRLAQDFPHPPRAYPVITRSVSMLWSLLRGRDLLAYIPVNLARPLLETGELVMLPMGDPVPIEPIGILQPREHAGAASSALADFLRSYEVPAGAGTKLRRSLE
jgi:DNA-binding transcriptional LysR family regulator